MGCSCSSDTALNIKMNDNPITKKDFTDEKIMPKQKIYQTNKMVKEIVNEIINDAIEHIIYHPSEDRDCLLCDNFTEKKDLFLICNKEECDGYICIKCANILMEQIVFGEIIPITKISCPYCRHLGSKNVLSLLNNNIISLLDFYCKHEKSNMKYIGVCRCGTMEIPDMTKYICNDEQSTSVSFVCKNCTFVIDKQTKICKKCHQGITKMFGCNHVVCSCGHEICWLCENKFGTTQCTTYKCNPIPKDTNSDKNMLLSMGFRDCPKCRIFVEIVDRSTVINCSCGTSWCWNCGNILKNCRCK